MKTRPRIAMTIVAAGEDDPAAPPADALSPTADAGPAPGANGRFHAVMIVEATETGDKRIFVENSIKWRDLPLPLMADDKSHPEHEESVLVGNIDTIERRGIELHGWGDYLVDPSEEAAYLIGLIKSGQMRGISADLDDIEFEILFPVTEELAEADESGDPDQVEEAIEDEMFAPLPTEEIDGQTYEVMEIQQPIMRVTESRLMGATALTFPALQEAWIEDDSGDLALAAAALPAIAKAQLTGVIVAAAVDTAAPARADGPREATPSRFSFPVIPPAEWFEVEEAPGPMPLTILDSGQVFGHLALWGECHIGISGECVEPPPSMSNYARFHVGEIPVAPDGRVSVGRLTFGSGGHADLKLSAEAARSHYDKTCTAAADLRAVDGEFGIWVCGAARSTLSLEDTREVMSSPPSGDWRRFGRDLELVAALCVNVPGFNTPRTVLMASGRKELVATSAVRVRKNDGLIASLIVSHPAPPVMSRTMLDLMDRDLVAKLRDRIALSISRDPRTRRAELAARVHGRGRR